jgi:hypothetical protein
VRDLRLGHREQEALDLVYRLGCLNARQLARLLQGGCSLRTSQLALRALVRQKLLRRAKHRPAWQSPSGPIPYVYYLSERGVKLCAAHHGILSTREGKKTYAQAYREGLIAHALLRNEYYATLAEETCQHPDRLVLEKLWAEHGALPVIHPQGGKGSPRNMPDGLVEVGRAGSIEPLVRVFVESDTGTQDTRKEMSAKIRRYCPHFSSTLGYSPHSTSPRRAECPTRIVFFSPTQRRSLRARRLCARIADEKGSIFGQLREYLSESYDLANLFLYTNLQLVAERGALGRSYLPMLSDVPVTLFDPPSGISPVISRLKRKDPR